MFSRAGLPSFLKEGSQHFQGLEEAVARNLDACCQLSGVTKTSFGPSGMKKLIVSHIEKSFVTSDAQMISEQLEVKHPAAKMVALAAQMQEQEYGDGTNEVIIFAGELLMLAASLIKQGLSIPDIIKGYKIGCEKALSLLESRVCYKIENIRDEQQLRVLVNCVMGAKVQVATDYLVNLTKDAILSILPDSPSTLLETDNIRVCKISGGSLLQSEVVNGMIISREPKGEVTMKENCKVVVLNCDLDMTNTETKGTVLLKDAEQLVSFSKTEEIRMEELIKSIKDTGCEAIIVGGAVSNLAIHYANKYQILLVTSFSKFEIKRLCRSLGAAALSRLGAPLADEMGHADFIGVQEIASGMYTLARNKDSKVATVVLRGTSIPQLEEIEQAINNTAAAVKATQKDQRFVAGAGSTEFWLGNELCTYATSSVTSIHQHAVSVYGRAFDAIPRILAESVGMQSMKAMALLAAAHKGGKTNYGIVIDQASMTSDIGNAIGEAKTIVDHFQTKKSAIVLATEAATVVLSVDHVIMSKPSGGPRFPKQGHWDAQDEQ